MSWQLRLLNAQLRLFARPRIARTRTPEDAYRSVRRTAWMAAQLPFVRLLERPKNLFWISCGDVLSRRVVLYFHGGGFVSGSPDGSHLGMLAALSCDAGVEICALRYPLAQEHPFPAQIDAAQSAWQHLMALGYRPDQVILGGDSAGGGLALALLALLCQRNERPAAAFAFSPWTDLTLTGKSLQDNADTDCLLPPERIAELRDLVLQGADPADPRASPLLADFPGCPPVWLAWSKTEILRDDAERMADRLRHFGARVDTEVHATAPHVWPLFQGWVPEGTETLKHVGRFIQGSFADSNR